MDLKSETTASPRYLAIVKDHEAGKAHPEYITSEQLGFPDYSRAEKTLYEFFRVNQHYLFAYECFLEGRELAVVQKVMNHFQNNFGPYHDNLQGITNLFKNLPLITRSLRITEVENPSRAYIVGAGPSLDLLERDLKAAYDEKQGVFICIDAAYKKLLKLGIRPHIVISSERVEETKYFFENLTQEDVGDTIGLFNAVSYPEVVANWPGRRAFYVRDAQEYHWLKIPGDKPYLETTPYTTYAATAFAIQQNFIEIVFVGQDFAYGPKGESHANLGVDERFNGPTGPGPAMLDVEGVADETATELKIVKTTHLLNMFAQELESLIEKDGNKRYFYNTSPIGRRISGTLERNLSGLFTLRPTRAVIQTGPMPLILKGLKRRAEKTIKEFSSNIELNPKKLESYKYIPDLAYHFLIQAFVLYQSLSFQSPEKEPLQHKLFNQTWTKVREDLTLILKEFVNSEDDKR